MCPHLCSFQIYARNVVEDYPLLLPDTFCGNVNNPIATVSHFLNFLCSLRQIEFYEFPGGQSHIFIAQIELQPRPELEYGSHVDIRVEVRREISSDTVFLIRPLDQVSVHRN